IGVVFRHNRDCTVILVKLCKFLAHPLNGHFKKLIPRRFLMSRTKRSRIAIIHLQKSLPLWEQSVMMAGIRDIAKICCTLMLKAGQKQRAGRYSEQVETLEPMNNSSRRPHQLPLLSKIELTSLSAATFGC
uniref:Uncharacterized protein n=1 Tax=Pundamilia nyererei TaxID=303518 RepID=A0A3B4EZG5_9CICH